MHSRNRLTESVSIRLVTVYCRISRLPGQRKATRSQKKSVGGNDMNRALVVVAIAVLIGMNPVVEAGTAGLTGIWSGEYIWADLDPGGGCDICPNVSQPWTFNFNNSTAEFDNTLVNTNPPFGGLIYTFHDTAFTDNNDGTYSGVILIDVMDTIHSLEYYDVPVDMEWDIMDTGIVTTLSGRIRGDSPFFPGSTMTFDGYIDPVPITPALYLFGTGLIGLVGMARRGSAV